MHGPERGPGRAAAWDRGHWSVRRAGRRRLRSGQALPLPRPSGDDSWHCPGWKKGPEPPCPRFGPASAASGVAFEFEFAPPEPDDVFLDLHPVARIRDVAHVTASLAPIRGRNCDPAPSMLAVRRGESHRADALSL